MAAPWIGISGESEDSRDGGFDSVFVQTRSCGRPQVDNPISSAGAQIAAEAVWRKQSGVLPSDR